MLYIKIHIHVFIKIKYNFDKNNCRYITCKLTFLTSMKIQRLILTSNVKLFITILMLVVELIFY